MNVTEYDSRKATIYTKNEFLGNIIKMEVTLIKTVTGREYAQYRNATEVRFRQKRKRKDGGMILSYNPYALIVDGWNNPDPADPWKVISEDNDMTVKTTRHAPFSGGALREFDEFFEANKDKFGGVLLDVRYTKGANPY